MDEQSLQASVAWWEYFVLIASIVAAIATFFAAVFSNRAYVWGNRRRIALSGGLESFKPIDAKHDRFENLSQATALIAVTVTLFGVLASSEYTYKNHELENLQSIERRNLANQATDATHRLTEAMNQERVTVVELKTAYEDLANAKVILDKVEKRTEPRTLTEIQKNTLLSMLKPEAPQEFYFIRAPDPEAQCYADEISAILMSAGWKPVNQPYNWGTMLTYPEGVEIMVSDIKKGVPRGAFVLQTALKKIGIEAQGVSFGMVENTKFGLYVGPKPTPKE